MSSFPRSSSLAHLVYLVIVSVVAALSALPAAAQQDGRQQGSRDRPFTGKAQVTAVELLVTVEDEAGRLPEDLRPEDFTVFEDGEEVAVVGVEIWRRGRVVRHPAGTAPVEVEETDEPLWTWHSVIYFDQVLSSSRSIRRAAQALATQARRLTQLGTVEIVTANPVAEQVLAPTRSSTLVEQKLEQLALDAVGRDELRRIRRQVTREQQSIGVERFSPSSVLANIAQETQLLRRQHDVLLSWVSQELHPGPRSLMLVNDGYDLRPQDFYFSLLPRGADEQFMAELNADATERSAAPDVEELAKTLASAGWVTVNMALGSFEAASTIGAEMSAQNRLGSPRSSRDPFARVDFVADSPDALIVRPLDPMRHYAVATGGDVLTGVNKLPASLEMLEDKVRLTYQVARLPDGETHKVEVKPRRPGLEIRAPRWSGAAAPEGAAAARSRRLLAGGGDRGEIQVEAAIALEPEDRIADAGEAGGGDAAAGRRGRLQARVDLRSLKESLAGAGVTPVRVTVAASFASEEGRETYEPFVRHELIDSQNLAGLDAWTYALPLSLPGAVERVSVVFEELGSGAWGGSLAAIVEGELPAAVRAEGASDSDLAASGIPEDLLPERKPILLLPFEQSVVRGRMLVDPVVADPSVVKVEYLLDGELAAESAKPPFSAKVSFGELPEPHLIEAVALAADGSEIGRDAMSLNEGVGAFRVRLIEPRSSDRVGPVDVEAEVKVPGGSEELDRVELYWSGEKVATLFEPPFRSRVFVPPESPVGYVSAVAHRTDGTSTEDVVFLNGTGPSERVDVELIELFTVVEDPRDKPVRGLDQGQFRIYEDGEAQSIADFRDGSEMPLSVGLLMDTSASMTPTMRAAQTAAIDFLVLALRDQDRAMVVGFDSRPQMVQPLTDSQDDLVQAIAGLRPGGTSALCDALVFSLVQMQRVPGRRALVVLTDGVGREERVDFGTCLRFVQRSGVPTYAILLAGDDPTAAGRGGVDREKLGRLVEVVGGRLFVAENADKLGRIYRSVIEELRSQYLLTYYPRRGLAATGSDDWRDVDVDVERPGLVARTIAGYYP